MAMIKIFCFLFPLLLQALIIQTNRMEEVVRHIDAKTWVFFDIDDTLIESKTQYGRAKWYWSEFKKLKDQGMDDPAAHIALYPQWMKAQEICGIQLLEPSLSDIVSTLQKIAVHTLGLTARHPPACLSTLRQLKFVNLDFSLSSPAEIPPPIPHALYEGGVWFLSDSNQKGVSVRKWIESLPEKPSKIVFVDDSRHHLENMQWELSDLGVEYIGIHYTKAHERPFHPGIAQIQADLFPEIISDEEALLRIDENNED